MFILFVSHSVVRCCYISNITISVHQYLYIRPYNLSMHTHFFWILHLTFFGCSLSKQRNFLIMKNDVALCLLAPHCSRKLWFRFEFIIYLKCMCCYLIVIFSWSPHLIIMFHSNRSICYFYEKQNKNQSNYNNNNQTFH